MLQNIVASFCILLAFIGISISYKIFLLVFITAPFSLNVSVWMKRIQICTTEGKKSNLGKYFKVLLNTLRNHPTPKMTNACIGHISTLLSHCNMLYDIIGSPGLLEKSEKGNRIAVSYLREECHNHEVHSGADV